MTFGPDERRMTDTSASKVWPLPLKAINLEYVPGDMSIPAGVGCIAWLVLGGLAVGILPTGLYGRIGGPFGPITILAATAIAVAVHRLDERNRKRTHDGKVNAAFLSAAADAGSEAVATTAVVRSLVSDADRAVDQMGVAIREAEAGLARADVEFNQGAFAPFWDAVEGATSSIAAYRDLAALIERKAREYNSTLATRQHTFGRFPVDTSRFPAIANTLADYARTVRRGQTNIDFATIYEHRATRAVLIEGFGNLAAALHGISAAVVDAVQAVQVTIDSGHRQFAATSERVTDGLARTEAELVTQTQVLRETRDRLPPGAT